MCIYKNLLHQSIFVICFEMLGKPYNNKQNTYIFTIFYPTICVRLYIRWNYLTAQCLSPDMPESLVVSFVQIRKMWARLLFITC